MGRYAVHAGDQLGVQVHEPRHHPFAWQWWHFVVNRSMSNPTPTLLIPDDEHGTSRLCNYYEQ